MSPQECAPIRVVLAEDEVTTRSAMATLLGFEHDIEVVGDCDNGRDALEIAAREGADVILTDLEMPGSGGLDVLAGVQDDDTVKVVVLTRHAHSGALRRAVVLGADGLMTKESPVQEVVRVIRLVHAGESHFDLAALDGGSVEPSPLTERETDVLRAAAAGAPVHDIAREVSLAPGTVRNYLSRVMARLHARTRHEAVRTAEDRGWL